ncbi:HTTM domain-containing protein [Hyphobacterium sp. CCMP332]|nr:HTTM domain-containing protein [Hyphobacterium sp. CCMP332]
MKSILNHLNKSSPSIGLGLFRILFGLIMLWEVIYFYRIGLIEKFIFLPATLFNYDFLPLSPMSEPAMQIILAGMLLSAVLITIGYYFRMASFYLFLSLSYIHLLDKGLYNNHIYLICLVCLMFSISNADASLTLKKSRTSPQIPRWQYLIFQIHIAMVYFFGGIAKINPYWLNMHPVKEILAIRAKNSGFEFISTPLVENFIMYGGLIFDMSIPFLLWYKRTRMPAIILALFFNLSNAWIFRDINIFPFFMMGALILFLDQDKVESYLKRFNLPISKQKIQVRKLTKSLLIVLSLYFIIHFILPFRHFLYPGYVDWTGEGQHFAWRMKIQHREIVEMKFALFDLDKREIHEIDPKNLINLSQYQQMSLHPRMAVQFAEYLKQLALKKLRIRNCMVKSKIKVTFNGSEPLYVFDPDFDLLQISNRRSSINEFLNSAPQARNY